jgi:DNA-binding PadR family transcriptional regulator
MREERRRRWKGRLDPRERDAFRHPPFPPQRRARFWREFFHDFTGSWPEDHWALAGRRFTPWHQGRDEYNPFVAALLSKGGGLLPLYVMHLLRETPRYGNEIMECITESTSRQWVANPGAIYPLMTMLEERGLARGEWEDPTKRTIRVYQLTEKGRQEMARLGAIMHPKLLEAIELLTNLAGELSESEAGYSDST